jgi:hypothetical protein
MGDQCKYPRCYSYALNDHPETGLCDKCWWRARAEVLEALVRAVGVEEFDGPFCENVGGVNWFDARNAVLAEAENAQEK